LVLHFTLLIPAFSIVIWPYYFFQNNSFAIFVITQCVYYYIFIFVISVIMLDSIYYLEHDVGYMLLR